MFFSVITVHIDDLNYTKGYGIMKCNDMSYCDYFRIEE